MKQTRVLMLIVLVFKLLIANELSAAFFRDQLGSPHGAIDVGDTQTNTTKKLKQRENYILNDGESFLYYEKDFFSKEESDEYMENLLVSLPWDWTYYDLKESCIQGPRKMAWFTTNSSWWYQFSLNHVPGLKAHAFTDTLNKIRRKIELKFGQKMNSVLANIYWNESEHSDWHSDDDPWLGYPQPTNIIGISFGYPRRFIWRKKHKKNASVSGSMLTHGSMVVMGGRFQENYQHSVPKQAKKQTSFRINLTFREIKYPDRPPEKAAWDS